MSKKALLAGISVLSLAIVAAFFLEKSTRANAPEPTACPDAAHGETAEDCPWADVARALVDEATEGRDVSTALQTLLPGIAEQLRKDSQEVEYKALWGHSINYDELAKGTIVHEPILDAITRMASAENRSGRIMPAGLEHTYGYLFSILKTPFGYKRARWVRDDIEVGFNLPRGTLGPTPAKGTLFTNVTFFAGTIALRGTPEGAILGDLVRTRLPESLLGFDFAALQPIRLEERLELGAEHTVTLRTDLVPFINQVPGKSNTHLLVYSVLDSQKGIAELVTAFPVESSFVDSVIDPKNLGENRPITTRYNAWVHGITDSPTKQLGSRTVIR